MQTTAITKKNTEHGVMIQNEFFHSDIENHQEIIGTLTNVSEEESSITLIIEFAKNISLPKNKELATKLKKMIGDKISILNFEGKYLVHREEGL